MLIAFTFSTLNAHPLYVQDFCQSPRKATPDISTRKKVAPGCAPVPDREQDRGRDDMRCEPSLCSFPLSSSSISHHALVLLAHLES